MKYGARNQITAKVTDVKRGDVMSLVKFEVAVPVAMASVITTESLDDLAMKPGDTVRLVNKAIHVLTVRDYSEPVDISFLEESIRWLSCMLRGGSRRMGILSLSL